MENGQVIVLVIEPEKSNQGAIERQLTAHGVKVIPSYTLFQGKEFFEVYKSTLDIVFLDDFSESSNIITDEVKELIKIIKNDPVFKNRGKLIAISEFKNEEMKKAGCDGIWSKHILPYIKQFIKNN